MRLIDADMFMQEILKMQRLNKDCQLEKEQLEDPEVNNYDRGQLETFELVMEHLSIQPTAYDIDKQWIPCSERLPKENQNVIACFAHGTVTELAFYDGKFHGMYSYDEKVITAWQPLPEPYKEHDS